MAFAREHEMPMTTGSDSHFISEMGGSYMLIDSEKQTRAILESVRARRARLVMKRQGMPGGIRRGLRKIRTYF
jgi:histidinol phosphatase-like PHP family hydrolase